MRWHLKVRSEVKMFSKKSLCSAFVAAAVAFAGVPSLAAAEPPPPVKSDPTAADEERAKELFDNGKSLYLGGNYDGAVTAFKEAYGLAGDPLLLYNIALAHDRDGDFDAAIEYLEYYMVFAPESERAALEEKVDSLRRRKLKEESEADASTAPPSPEAEQSPASPESTEPRADTDGAAEPRIFGPLPITLTALAVVGLAVGTGLGVASRRRDGDAQDACVGDPLLCPAGAEADLDGAKNLALGADISFGLGAAAGVAAIIVIAVNAAKRKKARGASAARPSRVALSPMRGGGSVHVRF